MRSIRISPKQRSIFLLISILSFIVLSPLLDNDPTGELVLVGNMYVTLVAAILELKEKPILFWSAVPVAVTSVILVTTAHFYPARNILLASSLVLALFFGLVCVSLFAYLGRKGEITERIYASVSLYLLLGFAWYSLYGVINTVNPGSFTDAGVPVPIKAPWSTFLYFSLVTLTTLGYGDVLPVKPAARMVAALEAAAGVLYVAITVARLVGSGQSAESQ